MHLSYYDYDVDKSYLGYHFFSIGPKGRIKKVVRFTLRYSRNGVPYYNLGFGDWDELHQRIDDSIVTNNEDVEQVLATVAAIVIDFTNHFGNIPVFAEGSTSARVRLYQMGVNKFKKEIESFFDVYGLLENSGWESFQVGTNYSALLVKRKKE